MGSPGSTTKSSDTAIFTSLPATGSPTSATTQIGGFDDVGFGFTMSRDENVPAVSRVTISGAGVTKVGPQEYTVSLSLGQVQTVQLTGGNTDATNAVTSGQGTFTYRSRNTKVATVVGGLVTPAGRGQAEIIVSYPKGQVNAWATSGADTITAALIVTVLA
jgi:hypothetical protein